MLEHRRMTEVESVKADQANISFLRQRMNALGTDFLLSQDSKGRNVLHKLMEIKNEGLIARNDFVSFISEILECIPSLVCQKDENKDTPVHILVRNGCETKINLHLQSRNDSQQINRDNLDSRDVSEPSSLLWDSGLLTELLELLPWRVQNANGNTPLHEAIIAQNMKLVPLLLDQDEEAACLVNTNKETPFHLLSIIENLDEVSIWKVLEANHQAVYMLDKQGLTPIMRAFKAGNLNTAITLCRVCPLEAAKIDDPDGQIFWHLLMKLSSRGDSVHELLEVETLKDLLSTKDKDGDTPLHIAIKLKHIDVLQDFNRNNNDIRQHPRQQRKDLEQWVLDLLEICNNDDRSPADLIADLPILPSHLDETKYLVAMGLRSSWGIPRSQLKHYMNSMNVIAALQTTITFTTAFTVPGGLMQDIGTPVLIRSKAFHVFLISDVIAMCLSMMVLICLLWIVATNNRLHSVKIQDFTIYLLLASFVATLLAFMTGVYATVFPVEPRMAIATLFLCSILTLLVPKHMVIGLLSLPRFVAKYFNKITAKRA